MNSEKNLLIKLTNAGVQVYRKWILSRINLSCHAKEIIALIGPNGAGKSTLVRTILGLRALDAGEIWRSTDCRFGYMPQRCHIDSLMPLTVANFLQLGQFSRGDADLLELLDRVKLKDLRQKMMYQLSGGEMQRVLLARALLQSPSVLVLDEPAQGVDINGQIDLYRTIDQLRHHLGCCVIMVSHDLHFVMENTDRVICLNHHICCQGHPDDIRSHPEFLDLFDTNQIQGLATYTHQHDHDHDVAGDIVSKDD